MKRVVTIVDSSNPARYGLVPYRRPKFALGEELSVRISSNFLKLAVFLCEDRGSGLERCRVPVATAFFVNVPCATNPNISFDYVVTARHVIEKFDSDTVWVRVNKKDQSSFTDFSTERADWVSHPEADVAVILSHLPMPNNTNELDYYSVGVANCVGPGPDYKYGDEPVSPGDELFAVGLFVQNYGKERNLPVARFGHISRMPDKVTIEIDRYGNTLDAVNYLAEFLSWGGVSGSPVFWLHPIGLRFTAFPELRSVAKALLGLVSSHFIIPKKAEVKGDVLGEILTDLNSGLATITPAEAICQLLMQDDMVRDRERRCHEHDQRQAKSVEVDAS